MYIKNCLKRYFSLIDIFFVSIIIRDLHGDTFVFEISKLLPECFRDEKSYHDSTDKRRKRTDLFSQWKYYRKIIGNIWIYDHKGSENIEAFLIQRGIYHVCFLSSSLTTVLSWSPRRDFRAPIFEAWPAPSAAFYARTELISRPVARSLRVVIRFPTTSVH